MTLTLTAVSWPGTQLIRLSIAFMSHTVHLFITVYHYLGAEISLNSNSVLYVLSVNMFCF